MAAQALESKLGPSGSEIPNIRKITLALDGSESSLYASEMAVFVAKGFKAAVTAVCVLPRLSAVSEEPTPDESARKSLESAMSMFTSSEGVTAKSEILEARSFSISEEIVDYVAKEKSDLVVCGNRGLGGFRRILLGSVSASLVTHSPCSVMVVRPSGDANKKAMIGRVLVAIDGSEGASKAVRLSVSLAKFLTSKLTFVNAVYLPPTSYTFGGGSWVQQAMEESVQEGKRATLEAQTFARSHGIEAETRVLDQMQPPVEALTMLAEKEKFDLIAVGTRGLGGFTRLALGSVASGIVHYAYCSVLVAK
jgi:nucleotide-binding universal stress UspA family protein